MDHCSLLPVYEKLFEPQKQVVTQCCNAEARAATRRGAGRCSLFKAPPSFGKTVCMAALIHCNRLLCPNGQGTLIIVPHHLIAHWKDVLAMFFNKDVSPPAVLVTSIIDIMLIEKLKVTTIQHIHTMVVSNLYVLSLMDMLFTKGLRTMFQRIIIDEPQSMTKLLTTPFTLHRGCFVGCFSSYVDPFLDVLYKHACRVLWLVSSSLDLQLLCLEGNNRRSLNSGDDCFLAKLPKDVFEHQTICVHSCVDMPSMVKLNDVNLVLMQNDVLLAVCGTNEKACVALACDDYVGVVHALMYDMDASRIIGVKMLQQEAMVLDETNVLSVLHECYVVLLSQLEHTHNPTTACMARMLECRRQLACIGKNLRIKMHHQTKTQWCMQYIVSKPYAYVIVYAEHPRVLKAISKVLASSHLVPCEVVEAQSDFAIEYFRSGVTRVLLLSSMHQVCGLGMPWVTDVIFMNDTCPLIASQVVGLAQRVHRKTTLNVFHLAYVEEETPT